MQQILHDNAVYIPLYDPSAVQGYRSDKFTGIPGGTLPPLNQYASNNLFLSVTPVSATNQTTINITVELNHCSHAGVSSETLTAIAAVIIIVVIAAAQFS